MKDLIGSLRTLRGLTDRIASLITQLGRLFRRAGTADPARAQAHGGHTSRPRSADPERQDQWAADAYGHIRANPDVDVIANNLHDAERLDGSRGFSPDEVSRIREHVFFEEHPLPDYEGGIVHQRYDPSAAMAEAWLRIRSGRPTVPDIALLEHELAESRYYDAHPGATYSDAHAAANNVSNWQDQIPLPTYEDYSTPWR